MTVDREEEGGAVEEVHETGEWREEEGYSEGREGRLRVQVYTEFWFTQYLRIHVTIYTRPSVPSQPRPSFNALFTLPPIPYPPSLLSAATHPFLSHSRGKKGVWQELFHGIHSVFIVSWHLFPFYHN